MNGMAYVFLRKAGAPLPLGCAGHVGWGFSLPSGRCYYGSTENPNGYSFVKPGDDNGWWAAEGNTQVMIRQMQSRKYDAYKRATIRKCNPSSAQVKANETQNAGYSAIGGNCLDHAWWILHAYGVNDLPWTQTHPSPNDWFAVFNGEYHNL